MKIFLLILVIIILLFLFIQTYTIMSTSRTEIQKYTVVHSENEFEIRFYPSATFATIRSRVKTYRELSGPGFRQLAGYIFGGNESETKIAMTSPVQMNINDTLSEMSFVMPSDYNPQNLPKPKDSEVIIHQTMDEHVAALRFSGFASDDAISENSDKLKTILGHKGIQTIGNFRFLGYNPPWQLVGRRNEIIVSVKWDDSLKL